LRRTAARSVERDIWIQQKGDVVARDVEIALVDLGHMRQGIKVLDLRPVGIVHDLTVFQIGDTENFLQRLALGVLDHGVVELFAGHEINDRTIAQGLFGQHTDVRPHEADFDVRIGVLDGAGQPDVAGEARGARKQHQEFVFLGNLDGLLAADMVRGGVEQARPFQHARRVGEPYRVPIRFDFARGGPARSCPSIEVFKRGRIQKQCFQWHMGVCVILTSSLKIPGCIPGFGLGWDAFLDPMCGAPAEFSLSVRLPSFYRPRNGFAPNGDWMH